MRTVDHQARTVIQKVEPRGEERVPARISA
jgi:hypothetical protein